MKGNVDTTFDMYSDTPKGRDPDAHSPTLRQYHRALWSKPLPDGTMFTLSCTQRQCYLYHASRRGEFFLSSDAIGNTYRHSRSMAKVVRALPADKLNRFFSICSTVGGYIIFPSRKIDNKLTINTARGLHSLLKDRFDLALECIRLHYACKPSPLSPTLARYESFFALFNTFEDYVDFFLLQDLTLDSTSVRFFLPFRGFATAPLPTNIDEYRLYSDNLTGFILARNQRIARRSA